MLRIHHWLAGTVVVLGGVLVSAQQLPQPRQVPSVQPPPAKADEDTEVLARGQLHEAFASSGEQPGPSPVIEKRPPDPVEELPPDQKPEGENVIWIPGYWDWDEDDKEFTWISGFWRNAPVGRVWVPGDWREVKGGYQWVPGFWNVAVPQQQQQVQPAQLEYLPPPPAVIESGPSVAAPSADCFYTPGCWVYRVNRYVWRPGFWVAHRPDWVWVPDCYRWTPCGYVFVPGYWDCPLATRGVLFAPVRFRRAVFDRPRFVYTPAYVVPDTSLHTCLFVRTGRVSYYFGDYFEQRYVGLGYSSWCGTAVRGSNFAVGVSVTRTTYDPLWSYYSLTYRDTPAWQTNVTNVYVGRFKGDVPRPPRTLVQQNTVINNVTNVTNNNTTVVVNNPPAQAVIAPLADVSKVSSQPIAMAAVKADDRVQEQKQAKELRQFAAERRKVETALVDKGQAVTKEDKPRQAKLEVPQAVAVRAQAPVKAENAPPPPAAPAKKPDPKTDPVPAAKPAVKPVAPPVIDPKTGAVQQKKPDDPKPTDPVKPAPKPGDSAKPQVVTPPTTTKPDTKPVNPQPPATTPKPGDPKPVDPKAPVTPPVTTPVTPKPADPPKPPATTPKNADPKPVAPPKVDPPKPPATTPTTPAPKPVDPPKPPATTPKPVDPPKVDPKPKDPPKTVEPVKPPVVPVKPPVTAPTTPAPKPVDPPKADPPKTVAPPPKAVDPPKRDAPKPVVQPPKPVDPPKPVVQPPKVEAPKSPPPAPVVNPAPKPVNPPKSVAPPPKPVEPPKPVVQPPKPTPPTKPKDEKKDKK